MTLIDALELAGIRTDLDGFFDDVGIIERIITPGVLQANGTIAGEIRTTIYSGKMSVDPLLSRRDRFDEFGQGLVFTRQYRVDLPYTVTTVQIRDRIRITTSQDPQLVGREMEVRDVIVETDVGLRRLTVHDFRE